MNVWAIGSVLIGGTGFVWGDSATVNVPKGSYRVKVTLPGETAPVIGPATLKLKAGFAYQVYAWGNGTDGYSVVAVGHRGSVTGEAIRASDIGDRLVERTGPKRRER